MWPVFCSIRQTDDFMFCFCLVLTSLAYDNGYRMEEYGGNCFQEWPAEKSWLAGLGRAAACLKRNTRDKKKLKDFLLSLTDPVALCFFLFRSGWQE